MADWAERKFEERLGLRSPRPRHRAQGGEARRSALDALASRRKVENVDLSNYAGSVTVCEPATEKEK